MEFGGNGESVLSHTQKLPEEVKNKIVAYMNTNPVIAVRASCINDYIEKKYTTKSDAVRSDGEYNWSEEETYHFEKYDMELNEDFIQKVMG